MKRASSRISIPALCAGAVLGAIFAVTIQASGGQKVLAVPKYKPKANTTSGHSLDDVSELMAPRSTNKVEDPSLHGGGKKTGEQASELDHLMEKSIKPDTVKSQNPAKTAERPEGIDAPEANEGETNEAATPTLNESGFVFKKPLKERVGEKARAVGTAVKEKVEGGVEAAKNGMTTVGQKLVKIPQLISQKAKPAKTKPAASSENANIPVVTAPEGLRLSNSGEFRRVELPVGRGLGKLALAKQKAERIRVEADKIGNAEILRTIYGNGEAREINTTQLEKDVNRKQAEVDRERERLRDLKNALYLVANKIRIVPAQTAAMAQ